MRFLVGSQFAPGVALSPDSSLLRAEHQGLRDSQLAASSPAEILCLGLLGLVGTQGRAAPNGGISCRGSMGCSAYHERSELRPGGFAGLIRIRRVVLTAAS